MAGIGDPKEKKSDGGKWPLIRRLAGLLVHVKWNLLIFRLTVWAVILSTLGAIVSKAMYGKPAGTPLHYLLGLALIAAILTVLSSPEVLSRLRKLGFKGFEIELLAETETLLKTPLYKEYDATVRYSSSSAPAPQTEEYPANSPFPVGRLKGPQRYQYERASEQLYRILDAIKDPNGLDAESRKNYRSLIKYVGTAAVAMDHFTKALDILKHLELFRDRDLDAEELRMLGTAHIWAAFEMDTDAEKRSLWEKSIPYLKSAREKNPYEVKIPFNLGWALLSLGQYRASIDIMKSCVELYEPITPWAKWNMACAQVKMRNTNQALSMLDEIPPGPWWEYISKDDDFLGQKDAAFLADFGSLCGRK